MKNLRFSSCPSAKVRHQGPPGSARAQPCLSQGIRKKSHKEICKLLAWNTCWKSALFRILKSMIFLLSTTEWICQHCCIWLIRAWYQNLVSWNGNIKGMSPGSVAFSPSPVHHSVPFTHWLLLFHPIFLPCPRPPKYRAWFQATPLTFIQKRAFISEWAEYHLLPNKAGQHCAWAGHYL